MRKRSRSGQTLVEYVLVFCALVVIVGSLVVFLKSTRNSVVRTERLVGSDYP